MMTFEANVVCATGSSEESLGNIEDEFLDLPRDSKKGITSSKGSADLKLSSSASLNVVKFDAQF